MEDLRPLVNIAKLTFVPLPFGSGNDLAQTLAWGPTPHQEHLSSLIGICYEICCNSDKTPVNIWDVTLEIRKDGDIKRVGADHKPASIIDKKLRADATGSIHYTATMANYFSMGECARIGFNFEKRRKSSRAGNMVTYASQWLKQFCCGCCNKKKQKLDKQIDYAHQLKPEKRRSSLGKGLPTIDEHGVEEDEETLQATFGRGGGLRHQLQLQSPMNLDD